MTTRSTVQKFYRTGQKYQAKKKSDGEDAYVTKRQVKQIVNRDIENKVFVFYGQDTSVDNTGSIHDLSNITTVGAQQGQRVGRKIYLKKIVFKAEIQASSSSFISSDQYNTVRIILFRWKEDTSSATPTLADILDDSSSSVAYSTMFPYNFNKSDQYKILYDKVIKVSPLPVYNGSGIVYSSSGPWQTKIIGKDIFGMKMGNKVIHYDNDINGHGKEKVYALFCADSTLTPDPTVNWAGQLIYEDA